MPQFFTRSGDDGYTGLLGDKRVPKYDPRTQAVGDMDEASAAIGLARASCKHPEIPPLLVNIQRDLYHIMAETAAEPENAARFRKITNQKVAWLEEQIIHFNEQVKIPSDFILPGDSSSGATLALARTIVRRAERSITWLIHNNEVESFELLRYMNRLSSLLFVLELIENTFAGQSSPALAKDQP